MGEKRSDKMTRTRRQVRAFGIKTFSFADAAMPQELPIRVRIIRVCTVQLAFSPISLGSTWNRIKSNRIESGAVRWCQESGK